VTGTEYFNYFYIIEAGSKLIRRDFILPDLAYIIYSLRGSIRCKGSPNTMIDQPYGLAAKTPRVQQSRELTDYATTRGTI
jgi:hypothetical protein